MIADTLKHTAEQTTAAADTLQHFDFLRGYVPQFALETAGKYAAYSGPTDGELLAGALLLLVVVLLVGFGTVAMIKWIFD